LIKYRAQLRGKEKANDLAANDQLHKEKLNKATSCLSMAASAISTKIMPFVVVLSLRQCQPKVMMILLAA
jgi:hypothetical protein